MIKFKIPLLAGSVFLALFILFELVFKYQFYYIEQLQLFIFSSDYLYSTILPVGGVAAYVSSFLVQFFILPYAGAFITALLLTIICIQTRFILKKSSNHPILFFLYVLPAIFLAAIQADLNYTLQGTVAYCIMLISLQVFFLFKQQRFKLLYALLSSILLFWLAGSIAILFALSIICIELIKNPKQFYWFTIPLLTVSFLCYLSVRYGFISEFKFAFLPDMYYHSMLDAPTLIYASWIALPITILVSAFSPFKNNYKGWKLYLGQGVQVVAVLLIAHLSITKLMDKAALKFQRLDYYAREENWDQLISYMGNDPKASNNLLYLAYINIAFIEKGELADKAFSFHQKGIEGLLLPWNKTVTSSIVLSDFHFATGNIALSLEMAFEGNLAIPGSMGPRTLQRMIQSNLIYGSYPVAEKYLNLFSKTLFYAKWAEVHQKFLYNDEAIESDSLLGEKRKCLVENNMLAGIHIPEELQRIAQANPNNQSAIEVLGVSYLLMKDIGSFKQLIETYYGTPVLPQLPKSFQEAIFIIAEMDTAYWKRFDIPESIVKQFTEFKKPLLAYRNNPSSLPGLLNRSFGTTYWFYYIFN